MKIYFPQTIYKDTYRRRTKRASVTKDLFWSSSLVLLMILSNPFFCVLTYTSKLKGSSMMMDTMGISIVKYTIDNNNDDDGYERSEI